MNADDDPERWLQQYGDALFSFAVMRVSDHSTAEDMVQETFLAAVKNQASFAGQSTRLTWLIGILKRKILDPARRTGEKRVGKQVSLDELGGDIGPVFNERGEHKRTIRRWPADPASTLQEAEFWDVFHECRMALPENLQAAFNLRELDQTDSASVCQLLGITASNLAVRIFRARLLLRQCLERKWFREEP